MPPKGKKGTKGQPKAPAPLKSPAVPAPAHEEEEPEIASDEELRTTGEELKAVVGALARLDVSTGTHEHAAMCTALYAVQDLGKRLFGWPSQNVSGILWLTRDYVRQMTIPPKTNSVMTQTITPPEEPVYAEAAIQTIPPPPKKTYAEAAVQTPPPKRDQNTKAAPPPPPKRKAATQTTPPPKKNEAAQTPPPPPPKKKAAVRPPPGNERPPTTRALVMHAVPLKYKPGTMRRWIEEDNAGVEIVGIRWLLKEDRRGQEASSLVIYMKTPVACKKLRMGRRLFRTTRYDWDR